VFRYAYQVDRETIDRDSDRYRMPEPMRRDVRLLGRLLGEVLSQAGGQDLLDDVEQLRHAVIEVRRSAIAGIPDPDSGASVDGIAALVASWPLDRAEQVASAFTVYFHLANLAEEHQRIRALRERDVAGHPLPESLEATVAQIRRDRGDDQIGELLAGLRVHPVFTAHPTEARRRAVVESLRRISVLVDAFDDPRAAATDHEETLRELREQIDVLWRTAQLRVNAMDPIDEVRTVMTAFDETLFRVVPALYRSMDHAVAGPDSGSVPTRVPAFLRFGSWVGADRDGNPFVTARVTREAATIQADHMLRALERVTTRIGRALTLHESMTPASPGLRRALDAATAAHPELIAEISARSPQEPYRTYLLYVAARLEATRNRGADLAYPGPEAFVADLRLVQGSLVAAGARRQAYGEVQHLIWQAETFGFHLAELEIRQHSAVHARVLAEVRSTPEDAPLSAEAEEVLATLRVAAWIQHRFGVEACRRYVVSFTRSAQDIAAVYELAQLAVPAGDPPVLDVVPLFESGEDLANAPRVLTEMLELAPVTDRLAANGRQLEAMLGYSDSAKELGPASATSWAVAQAAGSVADRFKVTEQGEVIFARYGRAVVAKRHLEQVTSAVLLASSPERTGSNAEVSLRYRRVADVIDDAARRTFRALVESDGFAEWFARISPLEEIGGLRIGSRPARRGLSAASLDDLRAIPWVFAWSQTRMNLPGWFGLGSGLATVVKSAADGDGAGLGDLPGADGGEAAGDILAAHPGLAELQRAYQEWPLFTVLIDNAEMSLAKTDRRIAERYLALGGRADLTGQVLAEYDLTMRLVLAVTQHGRLLADRPVLSRAVGLRDPYVDALSHLQLRALAALRGPAADDPAERARLERLLLLTVSGVAAGLQNTG
jgi:phosphoenolpyruvate carboxylase